MQGNVSEVTKANEVELSEKTSESPVPSNFEVCKDLQELPDTRNTDTKNIDTKPTNSFNDRLVPVEESFEEKKQYEQAAILAHILFKPIKAHFLKIRHCNIWLCLVPVSLRQKT